MTHTLRAAWLVLDIEGTLMPTSAVHIGLYDFARPRLGPWIDEHPDSDLVRSAVARTRAEAGLPESATTADVVAVLHRWMAEDRKAAPLKDLQGEIWRAGYASGELVSEYFPDVVPALRAWHSAGLALAVFSSGSVTGQVASFSNTTDGDLTPLFRHHFDTVNAGPKRAAPSYGVIRAKLGAAEPGSVLFLSDVSAELDAAASDGWQTVGLARPGEPFADADFGDHLAVRSFDEIRVERA
ncbi:acireductone synthase [Actinokineospora sp. G85]|uniref:acireductone synthase n=1 Tax=Actinokineospora sp. G85 TaxID=3406626 RepID=UPI003C7483AF